jgi:hypothetical protein
MGQVIARYYPEVRPRFKMGIKNYTMLLKLQPHLLRKPRLKEIMEMNL